MSNRAWMPLHIDDYIRDTDHLSATEHGAYLLLIMKYWRDGGLPSDEGLIRRYAKLSVDQWAESRDVIAALFDAGWHHKRIDEELAKASDIIEKRKAAGKKTQFTGKSSASVEQMPEQEPSKSSAPLTNNQEKEEPNGSSKKRGCRLPADFVPDIGFAISVGLTPSQAKTEADKFRDYWNGKTGASASKLDWPGTWRNWVRHALERMPQGIRGSPHSKASSSSALAESAARLVQSMRSADEIRSGSSGPGIPALIPHLPVR